MVHDNNEHDDDGEAEDGNGIMVIMVVMMVIKRNINRFLLPFLPLPLLPY